MSYILMDNDDDQLGCWILLGKINEKLQNKNKIDNAKKKKIIFNLHTEFVIDSLVCMSTFLLSMIQN